MEQTSSPPKASAWKQALVISAVVVACFALLNIMIWALYNHRAYPGVKVGGQDVGNLDTAAITTRVANLTADYTLRLQIKGQEKLVTAEMLGLQYEPQTTAMAAVHKGKGSWLPLYGLVQTWADGSMEVSYLVNNDTFTAAVTTLAGSDSVAPVDARVIIEAETVRVEPDKAGSGVDPKRLAEVLRSTIARTDRTAIIDERPTQATVIAEEAQTMVSKVQTAMKQPISLSVSGKSFTPGATEIGKWLEVVPDKDGVLQLKSKPDAIQAYLATVAGQVDVAPVTKQINMVNGEVKTVNQGKNGLALDRTGAGEALAVAVTSGQNTTITGAMIPVAYKTRTNNTIDLNGKYIEINLSRQHLWAYNDKQLVYDTPITSGATGAGFATIQGLFSIKAKQTSRNLNGVPLGYNYNVFVNYWMPFSGNYGMHDASWRTSFGGSDYYYGGSHGCVNLPAAAAAWVFNFVIVGTPVWVHS